MLGTDGSRGFTASVLICACPRKSQVARASAGSGWGNRWPRASASGGAVPLPCSLPALGPGWQQTGKGPWAWVWWLWSLSPRLADKNTGHQVKFEFQVNNNYKA